MKHQGIVVCLLTACLLAFAFPSQAAAANPILIVTNSSNPFTTYLPEIVRTEGFNEFDTADVSAVTGSTLTAYDLVILGDMSLTASQATILSNWVNGGGSLIAMHPDPQLAGLLGLASAGSTLADAYVLMNTATGPGAGLVGQTIQFHGPADLYTLNGATSYAALYSDASTPTGNPALTLNQVGSGQAAAFAYDLARSVVYTRQGNPVWSGETRDGYGPIRPDNLFFGAASFDPRPDYVDFNKIQIPQADEQQRLLANLMQQMNMGKKPLPRFWYLPKGLKAAVIMTGDDHGSYYSGSTTAQRFSDFLAVSPAGCSVADWECVRATAYLFPNLVATSPLTNSQVASYVAQGFEIGVHVDATSDCTDWTTSSLDSFYTNFLGSLASQFPSLPAPQTHRMHCVSWSDYDSQPQIELQHGIRLDTTYYYWPNTWINDRPGLFTGSGMPMRFTDRNGNTLNIYQAATQMTDESGQSYPLHINTLLDNALSGSGYYGVFTANMHNDGDTYPGPGANQIVASAQARGVPVVSSLQMLQWLDGRNGSSFGSMGWSGNVLSFSVSVGANANSLWAMLPANFGSLGLTSILLGGNPVSYQLQMVKGVQYAMFAASTGNYQATYGGSPLFSVSGAITPVLGAAGTTVTAIGPVTISAAPDSYGNYSLNGLPSGTYTITPSKSGSAFTPASQVVAVSGANVTAVNFSVLQNCPCSLWDDAVVPGTPSASDPNPVELGVRFSSDVPGFITGLRFYKGSTNTGTHIGNLWTNDGTLLASATFSNETASGWQQVSFDSPVAITANTTYVASYHTDAGGYSYDQAYFGSAFNNPPLHALQDGFSGANGVYLYGPSAFPTSTYLSSNYYVDVVLTTAQNYGISGTISGAGGSGATVSLTGASTATVTADAFGNYNFAGLANGSYTVTPSSAAFTFTPASQSVTVNDASVTGVNFGTVSSTYSISGTVSGVGGGGATVSLTGTSTATATADASGFYTFSGLANGSYTVTPGKSGLTFTPASQSVTVNNASVAGVNFSTVVPTTYSLSGTIGGSGGNGATVNLTGASSATVAADASGSYTFSGLSNGSYTVTPSKAGFTFTPASQSVTLNNANVTGVNFSIVAYTISGTISGTGGNSATVTLSGTSTATVTADASGNYSFNGLNNGSYTVTPSKSGYSFTPPSAPVTVSGANVSGVNFASPALLALDRTVSTNQTSGRTITSPTFSTASANELLLALVSTDGSTSSVTVSSVSGGSLTWTLVRRTNSQRGTAEIWRAFSSTPKSNMSVTANLSQSVASTITVVTFSGVDTSGSNGSGAIGATGTGNSSRGAPTASLTTTRNNSWVIGVGTDADNGTSRTLGSNQIMIHQYTTSGFTGWVQGRNSTIAAAGTSVTINDTAPSSDRYNLTIAEVLPSNSATGATFTIAGAISGPGGSGATVNLTGASTATVTADASGNYSFNGRANGSYTVTASKSGFTFSPASQSVTVNNGNVTGVNFSSVVTTYSISGTISGLGGNGATVTLTGASTATVTANASGSYTFSGLLNGSYTVTPSKAGFSFTPASQAVTVNSANVSGLNFSTITYTITGTISGTGGNAATVNLTGASTATATADALGNYTFSGLVNGSYTVTPSKSGFTFSPASQSVTVSNASVAGVNFSATALPTFSISGSISGTGGNGATVTLSGAASATVTASATGTYTFSNLLNGSYTVTPSKSGFIFAPANKAVTVNGANVTGVNFTATGQLAIDQSVSADASLIVSSITSPAFSTTKTNELLLALVSTESSSVSSVTGGGLTWSLVRRTNTQQGTAEIWRAFSASTLSNITVRASLSQTTTAAAITVVTFSGVDTSGSGGSGAIGATAGTSASSGAPTASLTTTRNNSWVLGVGVDSQRASSRTVGSNQTMVHQGTSSLFGFTGWMQRQNSTTPASGTVVTVNDTAPTSDRYNLSICEVLPAQ
jgi:hypothetical protein